MFSISESGNRAGAEGQEKAAAAPLRPPWQTPHKRIGGGLLLWGENKLSKNRPSGLFPPCTVASADMSFCLTSVQDPEGRPRE